MQFAKKDDLANLKSDVDKLEKFPNGLNSLKSKVDELDVDKMRSVPVDLSKLTNAVNNDLIKRDVFNTDKKRLRWKIEDVEKIPDASKLVTLIML